MLLQEKGQRNPVSNDIWPQGPANEDKRLAGKGSGREAARVRQIKVDRDTDKILMEGRL